MNIMINLIKNNKKIAISLYYVIAMISFFVPRQFVPIIYPIRLIVPLIGILLIALTPTVTIRFTQVFPFLILYTFGVLNGVKNEEIVMLLILAILFKDDLNQLFKLNFWFIFLYIIITSPLATCGIIHNTVIEETRGIRHGFFFTHPNQFGLALVTCLTSLFYLYKAKLTKLPWYGFAAILILSIFLLNNYVMTRTNTLICIFLLVLVLIDKFVDLNRFAKFLYLAIPATIFLVFLLTFLYPLDIALINKLNEALSGRIGLQAMAFENYSIPLFGLNMHFGNNIRPGVYDALDSAIYNFSYTYGLILFVYVFTLFTKMTKKVSQSNPFILVPILVLCLTGITENVLLNFVYNPVIVLVCASFIFKSKGATV